MNDRAIRSKLVVDLLKKELPKMQPSALKHVYLTSVVNVYNHSVAEEKNEADGSKRLIGFADLGRQLPLTLIIDKDGTIRHAFVPSVHTDRELLRKLQANENRWAEEHGTRPRDIASRISGGKRDEINVKGLGGWKPPHTEDEAGTAHRSQPNPGKPWYDTRPLPKESQYDTTDLGKISANVTRSTNMNLQRGDSHVRRVNVVVERTQNGRALAVKPPLFFDEPERPTNDDDFTL